MISRIVAACCGKLSRTNSSSFAITSCATPSSLTLGANRLALAAILVMASDRETSIATFSWVVCEPSLISSRIACAWIMKSSTTEDTTTSTPSPAMTWAVRALSQSSPASLAAFFQRPTVVSLMP